MRRNRKATMEMDWPHSKKAMWQHHKEGVGLEPTGEKIKRKTQRNVEKSGERSDGKVTASSEVYDPATDTWNKCGMLLAPRANCACAGYGRELLCAGGFHGGAAHNNLWIYEHHRWQEMDEDYPHRLPYNLDKCAIATVANTFFFIGGVSTIESKSKSEKDKNKTEGSSSIFHGTSRGNNNQNFNNNNNNTLKVPAASKSPERGQKKVRFQTQRKVFSYTTQISAGEKIRHGQQPDLISPWNFKLPPMIHARHSAGAVAVGHKIHVVGGTSVETGQMVQVSETFDLLKGIWEEDFTLRKCDVSNVCCVLLEVPKIPPSDRLNKYRLRHASFLCFGGQDRRQQTQGETEKTVDRRHYRMDRERYTPMHSGGPGQSSVNPWNRDGTENKTRVCSPTREKVNTGMQAAHAKKAGKCYTL
ncbi:kelch-like protein 9 [Elysia marginata]|uniref:Kelch-like protein 9 n=1 Tax=Elysia marginata TaxID=1093978 RepID=A0AAV4EFN3_9GAST|nr:kelch-like protein 9 [Elysia marginata]